MDNLELRKKVPNNLIIAIILVFFSSLAAWSIILTTHFGVGLSPDSLVYIAAGKSFIAGKGFIAEEMPLTRFPPAYPVLIALTDLVLGNPLINMRWTHALLFAVNTVLVGTAVYTFTNKKLWAVIASILLFLSSKEMLKIHNMAWSEPLFIAMFLSAVIFFALYISRSRVIFLVIAGIFLCFATMTRFAGTALLTAMVLALFISSSEPIKKRLRDCIILSGIAIVPFIFWLVRGHLLSGDIGGRSLAFHPIPAAKFIRLIKTAYAYWFPFDTSILIRAILLLIVLVVSFCAFIFIRRLDRIRGQIPRSTIALQAILILFACTYMLFFLLALIFLDAAPTFDYRILSVLHPAAIILVVSLCWCITEIYRIPIIRLVFAVVFIPLVFAHSKQMIREVNNMRKDGRGYASRKWRYSECLAYAKSLQTEKTVYSNGYDLISFFAGKEVKCFPVKVYTASLQSNPDYETEMKKMQKEILENQALIIYFNKKSTRWNIPKDKELEEVYQIPVLLNLDDGKVFAVVNDDLAVD